MAGITHARMHWLTHAPRSLVRNEDAPSVKFNIEPARAASRSQVTAEELAAFRKRSASARSRRGKFQRTSSTLGMSDLRGIKSLRDLDKVGY